MGRRARTKATLAGIAGMTLAVCAGGFVTGCGLQPGDGQDSDAGPGDVIVSIINVTPFDVSVLVSAVLDDVVDTVERTVAGPDSTDVTFVCVDELVLGDPIEPDEPGVIIDPDGLAAEIEPFSIFAGDAFLCGDLVEFVISGNDADTFVVDVFAFAPP